VSTAYVVVVREMRDAYKSLLASGPLGPATGIQPTTRWPQTTVPAVRKWLRPFLAAGTVRPHRTLLHPSYSWVTSANTWVDGVPEDRPL